MNAKKTQLDLFSDILDSYFELPRSDDSNSCAASYLSNSDLYERLASKNLRVAEDLGRLEPIGESGEMHSLLKRQVRWYQQTLKALGLLEKDTGINSRGRWKLTSKGDARTQSIRSIRSTRSPSSESEKLTPPRHCPQSGRSAALLGFSTALGAALWSRAEDAFPSLDEPINLCLSSLPYPLAVPRDYGNPKESEYVDWVCKLLEPIVSNLAHGASVVLNVGNDVFVKGSPARSIYKERMVIALNDRLGLQLMDTLIWENPSRPPGPLRYASLSRQQLNASYEPFYWFSNAPNASKSNNRRVLMPHSETHRKLITGGGEQRDTAQSLYGDGAHRVRKGSYGNETAGKIPRNVISMGHRCADKSEMSKLARAAGLPVHGATMPLKLAKFMIEFMTEKNDLVVDPCAGWFRTAKAAEITGRRWFATEQMGQYVLGGALGMRDANEFECFGELVCPPQMSFFSELNEK